MMEAYEEAEIFLGNYLSSGVYDDAYLLARARLYGLQENYDGAEGLYRMLIDRKSKAAGKKHMRRQKFFWGIISLRGYMMMPICLRGQGFMDCRKTMTVRKACTGC